MCNMNKYVKTLSRKNSNYILKKRKVDKANVKKNLININKC